MNELERKLKTEIERLFDEDIVDLVIAFKKADSPNTSSINTLT